MSSWCMYWLLMLDNIRSCAGTLLFVSSAVGVFGLLGYIVSKVCAADGDTEAQAFNKGIRNPFFVCVAVWVLMILIYAFAPTTKQAAAIFIVPKIINNETVQEIPKNLLDLGNAWMKEKTEQLNGVTETQKVE